MAGGIIGPTPNLADLVEGDVRMAIDFRQGVYATLLDRWLDVRPAEVLAGEFCAAAAAEIVMTANGLSHNRCGRVPWPRSAVRDSDDLFACGLSASESVRQISPGQPRYASAIGLPDAEFGPGGA